MIKKDKKILKQTHFYFSSSSSSFFINLCLSIAGHRWYPLFLATYLGLVRVDAIAVLLFFPTQRFGGRPAFRCPSLSLHSSTFLFVERPLFSSHAPVSFISVYLDVQQCPAHQSLLFHSNDSLSLSRTPNIFLSTAIGAFVILDLISCL